MHLNLCLIEPHDAGGKPQRTVANKHLSAPIARLPASCLHAAKKKGKGFKSKQSSSATKVPQQQPRNKAKKFSHAKVSFSYVRANCKGVLEF